MGVHCPMRFVFRAPRSPVQVEAPPRPNGNVEVESPERRARKKLVESYLKRMPRMG